jgi:imidazolonepropionase-like amidohydrolase
MNSNQSVLALAVALLPLVGIAHVQPAATIRTSAATTRATATARATAPSLYIEDVTVIDTETGTEAQHRTVKILGGRISAVVAARTAKASSGARTVEASGKFLIPGLWDMHVHGNNQPWFADFFPLYLANGVTGIREMFGPPNAGQFRADLTARHIDAPRIYLASPIVDGYPPVWPKSISVKTPAEARQAVDEQVRNGADFIKIYGMLSRDEYFAIIDEAKKKHIDVEGHVPRSISIWEATAAKQKSIEHLNGIGLGCSAREEELWPKVVAAKSAEEVGRLVVEAARSYDDDKCRRLFAEFKRNNSWPVPTLTVSRSFALLNDPKFTKDERTKYFGGEARRWLVADDDFRLKGKSDEYFKLQREYFAFDERLVGELFRAGVPMLAGTDVGNPYCFPGFSLHDELAMRVEAGVSPLAALQAATRNAALFMGAADKYGSVKPGMVADLVLLDADPLVDIHNTARISAVFLGGKVFDRAALDGLLSQAEKTASADR